MPIKPTRKEIYRNVLEKERILYEESLDPIRRHYNQIIRTYGKDRGFCATVESIDYYLTTLLNLQIVLNDNIPYFPANRSLLEITEEVRKRIEKIGEIIRERTKESVFFPDDFVNIVYRMGNANILLYFSYGLWYLREGVLVGGRSIRRILDQNRNTVLAFVRKMNNNQNYGEFYIGEPKPFAFTTLVVIDAHDNSLLEKLIKEKDREVDLLRNYVPEKGLTELLFAKEEEVKKKFREAIRLRKERQMLCSVKNLSSRLDYQKVKSYVLTLYPQESLYII